MTKECGKTDLRRLGTEISQREGVCPPPAQSERIRLEMKLEGERQPTKSDVGRREVVKRWDVPALPYRAPAENERW